jgi:nitrogen regulatory protein PII
MAKMIILITTQVENGMKIAEAWEEAGASGVTIIESYGLHRLRERGRSMELPLFVSLASVLRQTEQTNQTILTVVEEDLVEQIVDAACEIIGDINNPDSGIAFVLDVERTFGLNKFKKQEQQEDE